MSLGERFTGGGGKDGLHPWSLGDGWIDLGMLTNEPNCGSPREDLSVSSRKRSKERSCTRSPERDLKRACLVDNESAQRVGEDDVFHFFEGLFQIADALFVIHELWPDRTDTMVDGWHHDIKPDNILLGSNSFTHADKTDLGTGKIEEPHSATISQSEGHGTHDEIDGTQAYDASECYHTPTTNEKIREQSNQSYDLWSLGHVLSEAATWIMLGVDNSSNGQISEGSKRNSCKAILQRLRRKHGKRKPDGLPASSPESKIDILHIMGTLQREQKAGRSPKVTFDSNRSFLRALIRDTLEGVNGRHEGWGDSDSGGIRPNRPPGMTTTFSESHEVPLDHTLRHSTRTKADSRLASTHFRESQYVLDRFYVLCLATDSMDDDLVNGSWNHCISTYFQERQTVSRTIGTGQWLLEDCRLIRWMSRCEGTFWLTGLPGTGKSTLASLVFDTLQSNCKDGEFFVNYQIDPDFRGPSAVAGILWEMLMQWRLRERACKSHLDLRSVLADLLYSGDRLSTSRMKYIFSKIQHCLKANETLYLFVDGLSDFESQKQRDMLHEFFDHAGRFDPHHRIKLFISSSTDFFSGRDLKGSVRVNIDRHPQAIRDLALYVRSVIKSRTRDQHSLSLSNGLLEQTGASFLTAQHALQSIDVSSGTEIPLKTKLNKRHVPRSTSSVLPSLYMSILGQLEKRKFKFAKVAFSWIADAARPLHSSEIVGAIHMQTGSQCNSADILKFCGSLVVVDDNQIVRFRHYSVRQFLKSPSGRKSKLFVGDANEMIADTCLQTLYPQTLLRSLKLPANLSAEKSSHLAPERDPSHRESLLSYACRYWVFHYRLAEPGSSYIAGLLHKFLGRCIASPDLVNTALSIGARNGFLKLIKLELEMGANINFASGTDDYTPLIWAAKSGHLDAVKLLLEYGADPRIPSGSGTTPLMLATANGHLEIIELLLSHGTRSLEHDWQSNLYSASSSSTSSVTLPEEFSLEVILSSETIFSIPCSTCGAVEAGYELSVAPGRDSEMKKFHPITIKGEYISQAEMEFLQSDPSLQTSNTVSNNRRTMENKRAVKWFAGAKMHRSLEIAARRGIEDIKKLLVAVGNDSEEVEMSMSASKLLAKMRMS